MLKNIFNFGAGFFRLGSSTSHLSSMFSANTNRLVWMDMEMTGLDIEKDHIMEIACLITDSDLNIVAEGPDLVLHQPQAVLDQMGEWCIKQHGKTGLTEASQKSTVTVHEAEEILLNFISKHALENCSPLAGNTVYMDRLFLRKHMPRINSYLHYRIIDVSSIKELCRLWKPDLYRSIPPKNFQHRALADIKESVAELKFYKNNFFNVAG